LSTSFKTSDKSLRVFVIFFLGWFVIHSTSGQHFSYALMPTYTIVQAIFFSFGALCIAEADNH
jgi:hypothetical protein